MVLGGNSASYRNPGYIDEQGVFENASPNLPRKGSPSTSFTGTEDTSSSSSSEDATAAEVTLAWRNLRYEVSEGVLTFKRKPLLRRLNGFFTASSLNALMGPSGAGKTTLLSCLSGASTGGLTGDSEMFIGTSLGASPVTYFIEQHVHETIIPELTVGQILRYAFAFKNAGASTADREAHIKETLRDLLLDESILGRPYGRCSGGEQKRVAIGQELMSRAKADFLLVDEPTTGLDSFAALEVIKCLARLARTQQMTVVASIHSPNEEILTFFSKVYVLAKGGVALYAGPPGERLQEALDGLDCTQARTQFKGETPIECLVRIAAADLTTNAVLQSLANRALSTQYNRLTPHLPSLRLLPSGLPNTRASFTPRALVLSLCRQSRVAFLAQWRLLIAQLLFILGLTLTFASFFNSKMVAPDGCYQLAANDSSCVSNDFLTNLLLTENINYICLNRAVNAYIFMATSTLLYSTLVKVFRNEHRNRWYSLGVFYLSTSIVSFLQIALFSLLLAAVSYFAVSEHAIDGYALNPTRLGHYGLCLLVCMLFIQSLGQLISVAIIDSLEIALIVSTTLFSMIMMLDDFFFKTDELKHKSFIVASNLLGMKYITRYLIYVFYGLNRCEPETQFSWVMAKNYADEDLVPYYIYRVLGNALAIRLLTFILMFCKFNPLKTRKAANFGLKTSQTQQSPIDFTPTTAVSFNNNPNSANLPERAKENQELEFEAFSKHKIIIAWRNLSLFGSRSIYEIGKDVNPRQTPILSNLNGEFQFGTLNGLMGMSGAGKTSLLKVLNGRCRTRLSPRSEFHLSKFTKIETAFITQEVSGHLMPGLTAKQSLIYASRLKNEKHVSSGTVVDHETIARTLLGELNLTDAEGTKVERCSGGERKRLALAMELTSLQMPNLICIDEPTSGLDSNSAGLVVSSLRKIAHAHNLTIIASIHQPNSHVLSLFDTLYVLARGGVAVYSGPSSGIAGHLSAIPALSATSHPYPIEALIKHSAAGPHDPIVRQLSDLTYSQLSQDLPGETQPVPDGVLLNRTRFSLTSVTILTHRYLAYIRGHLWKQWLPFLALYLLYGLNLSLFFDPSIALPSGCLSLDDDFNNTCSRTPQSLAESQAILDNLRYNLFFSNLFILIVVLQTGLSLLTELPSFYNEHRNGWYSTGSFTLTKTLLDLLFYLPILLIYIAICNIYEPVRPGIYPHLLLLLLLALLANQSLAYIFTVLCRLNTLLTLISFISLYMTFQLLSNLFINLKHLHYVYQLASYLTVPRFTLEGLVLLEYGFGRCAPGQIQPVLYWMSLKDQDYTFCLLMLLANLILYRLIAIWILIKKVNPPENRRERLNRIENYLEEIKQSKSKANSLSNERNR